MEKSLAPSSFRAKTHKIRQFTGRPAQKPRLMAGLISPRRLFRVPFMNCVVSGQYEMFTLCEYDYVGINGRVRGRVNLRKEIAKIFIFQMFFLS